jgi:hypothetical protein
MGYQARQAHQEDVPTPGMTRRTSFYAALCAPPNRSDWPLWLYGGAVFEIGSRKRNLPAPPSIVWESLTHPHQAGAREWLNLLPDEVEPKVLRAEKPSRVVWSSLWPSRPNDQVHLELTATGVETVLRFTLLTPDDPPDESKTGHLRHRLNHLLFADLRFSYGQ